MLTKEQNDALTAAQKLIDEVKAGIASMRTDGDVEPHKVTALNKLRAAINTLTEA